MYVKTKMTTIDALIPLQSVSLTNNQVKELLELVPEPEGLGKTAKLRARENIQKRIEPILRDVKLLRDQLEFTDLKRAITAEDNNAVVREIRTLATKYAIPEPNLNIPEDITLFRNNLSRLAAKTIDPRVWDDFVKQFQKDLRSSRIQYAQNVGSLAGLALGQPVSQSMLSDFHAINVTFENSMQRLDRIESILKATKEINVQMLKSYLCLKQGLLPGGNEHFSNIVHRGTIDEIYDFKRKHEEVTINTISLNPPIIQTTEYIQETQIPRLFHIFTVLNNRAEYIYNPNHMLEIALDPYKLWLYNLDMKFIVDKFNDAFRDFNAFYTSQNVSSDPNTNKLFILTKEPNQSGIYNLINKITRFHIQGIPKITRIAPVKQDIIQGISRIVLKSTAAPAPLPPYPAWQVDLNKFHTSITPTSIADVYVMLTKTGFHVNIMRDKTGLIDKFILTLKFDDITGQDEMLKNLRFRRQTSGAWRLDMIGGINAENLPFINQVRVSLARRGFKFNNIITELNPLERIQQLPQEDKTFYSMIAFGINHNAILQIPEIDFTKYYINDIFTMYELYGFYSSYQVVVNELIGYILGISDSTDVEHMLVIMDTFFTQGIPGGITARDVEKRGGEFLERSSLDRGGEILSEAGAAGTSEEIKGVTSSIHVGELIAVGSGLVQTVDLGTAELDVQYQSLFQDEEQKTDDETTTDEDEDNFINEELTHLEALDSNFEEI